MNKRIEPDAIRIDDYTVIATCPNCGETTEGRRLSKVFCDAKCRASYHEKRRRRAQLADKAWLALDQLLHVPNIDDKTAQMLDRMRKRINRTLDFIDWQPELTETPKD